MSNLYTHAYAQPAAAKTLCLLAATALAGCHGQPAAPAPPAAVVALPVHAYSGSDGGQSLRYPIEAAARYANVMSFRVAGKIVERTVRLGDVVRRGTVVARLDATDAAKQAAAARAGLDAAEHRLTFAQQTLDRDSAWWSVLAQMNSTPSTPRRIMCSTALPPAPPTPITLITVPTVSVSRISNAIMLSHFRFALLSPARAPQERITPGHD